MPVTPLPIKTLLWLVASHLNVVPPPVCCVCKSQQGALGNRCMLGSMLIFRLSREATWSDRISTYTLSHRTRTHTLSGQNAMTPVLGGLTVSRENEERGCCLMALGGLACRPSAELEQMWPIPRHQGLRSLMSAPNWTQWHLLTDGGRFIFPFLVRQRHVIASVRYWGRQWGFSEFSWWIIDYFLPIN